MAGSGYLTGDEGQRAATCPEDRVAAVACALAAAVVNVRSGMGSVLHFRLVLQRGQCFKGLACQQLARLLR